MWSGDWAKAMNDGMGMGKVGEGVGWIVGVIELVRVVLSDRWRRRMCMSPSMCLIRGRLLVTGLP